MQMCMQVGFFHILSCLPVKGLEESEHRSVLDLCVLAALSWHTVNKTTPHTSYEKSATTHLFNSCSYKDKTHRNCWHGD